MSKNISILTGRSAPDELDIAPVVGLEDALVIVLAVSVGTLAGVFVLPAWLPGLSESLLGAQPKAYWYLARVSGLTAYLLLWLSVTFGVLITNRMARLWRSGPTVVDLHQFASLLALVFAIFHGLILLGDRYITYTLDMILIPFAHSDYRPFWVGLGQVCFYLALPVTFSFYARRVPYRMFHPYRTFRIGYRAWRVLHYAGFALYLLATAHGLFAGTDSATPVVLAMYGVTGITTYFLIVYRLFIAIKQPPLQPRGGTRDVPDVPRRNAL